MKKYGSFLGRLKIAHLFLGMMFWFGIEQLFLNKYLGTSSARGYVTGTFMLSMILFDVPSGIIADKFGRKRVIIAACGVQIAAVITLGFSSSLGQYLVGTALYGIFAVSYTHLRAHETDSY